MPLLFDLWRDFGLILGAQRPITRTSCASRRPHRLGHAFDCPKPRQTIATPPACVHWTISQQLDFEDLAVAEALPPGLRNELQGSRGVREPGLRAELLVHACARLLHAAPSAARAPHLLSQLSIAVLVVFSGESQTGALLKLGAR